MLPAHRAEKGLCAALLSAGKEEPSRRKASQEKGDETVGQTRPMRYREAKSKWVQKGSRHEGKLY